MVNQPGMGGAGNKVPIELVRLRGNPGKKSLPDERTTQALATAEAAGVLDNIPGHLNGPGKSLWRYIWNAGACWISPQTDLSTVTKLCELTDYGEIMRAKFMQTGELCYSREYFTAIDKQIALMRELGLTPAARSKLGVAEVKTASRIEQLRLDREREQRLRQEAHNNGK